MHRSHDLELVAALARGEADEAGRAAALVATCPDCAAAYESHRIVLAAVEREGRASLTDLERHRLHAAVWDATRHRDQRRSTPWWYRAAPVAAVLVVVVGVASQLGSPDAGGDAASVTTAAEAPVDGFQSFQGETDAPEMAEDADTTEAAAGSVAPDKANTDELTAETASPSEWTGTARVVSPDALVEAAERFETTATLATGDIPDEATACVADDPDVVPPEPAVSAVGTEIEGTSVWIVGFGADDEIKSVRIYSDPTCTLLYPPPR